MKLQQFCGSELQLGEVIQSDKRSIVHLQNLNFQRLTVFFAISGFCRIPNEVRNPS